MQRIELMGCPMDVASMGETVTTIRDAVAARRFTQHVVVNVAKLVNMRTDPQLDASVRACDIINIDGMGVVIGARFLGHDVPERVAGVDLFHALLAMSAREGFSVFLLGAKDEVVSTAATTAISGTTRRRWWTRSAPVARSCCSWQSPHPRRRTSSTAGATNWA